VLGSHQTRSQEDRQAGEECVDDQASEECVHDQTCAFSEEEWIGSEEDRCCQEELHDHAGLTREVGVEEDGRQTASCAEVSGEHPSREEQAGSQALRILRLA
jgi:hypothetical protein